MKASSSATGSAFSTRCYGDGEPTFLLLPTWSIIHSRHWKAQIHYLARHARVVTFDGRGNGRSDRPSRGRGLRCRRSSPLTRSRSWTRRTPKKAIIVGLSAGAQWGSLLAAEHPLRVLGAVFLGPAVWVGDPHPERAQHSFTEPLDTDEGWAKENVHYWRRDYRGYLEFFFGRCLTERHSTKQLEDCIGWALETDPETLAETRLAIVTGDPRDWVEVYRRIACPVLVIHGDEDALRPHATGAEFAELTDGRLATIERRRAHAARRKPVEVNLLLREFAEETARAVSLKAPERLPDWVLEGPRPARAR